MEGSGIYTYADGRKERRVYVDDELKEKFCSFYDSGIFTLSYTCLQRLPLKKLK